MNVMGRRLVTRAIALAAVVVLALPLTAHAATFSSEYPTGLMRAKPQIVAVSAFSAVAFDTRAPQIRVDGTAYKTMLQSGSVSGFWQATEVWNATLQVWQIRWTWVPTTADPNKTTLYCYPSFSPTLTDGTHNVVATIKDKNGVTWTDTWSFSYQASPTIGAPIPAPGSTATTLTPTITVPVSDNGPGAMTASAVVNGAPAAATVFGGVVSITSPSLTNDATSSVTVTVTDAAGNVSEKTWSFFVEIYPEMASTVGQCADCHVGYEDDPDMAPDCSWCHPGPAGPHPGTPTSLHTRTDIFGCSPCHVSDVTVEHARNGRNCLTCHASADAVVVAAIASGQTACLGCHPGAPHTSADAAHEAALAKCTVPGCHTGQLPTIHGSQCSSCHTVSGIEPCITCHPAQIDTNGDVIPHGFDPAKHIGNDTVGPPEPRENGCSDRTDIQSGCHDISNVASLHEGVVGGACAVCHAPDVTPSTNCRSCHPEGYSAPAPGVLAGGSLYHHLNVKYLNDRSDAPADAYYYWDPDFHGSLPPGGWNDALSAQDCQEKCHKDSVYVPGTPPYSGSQMWYSLSSVDPYPLTQSPPRSLARSVTLPAEPTTLTFKAMWQLEYFSEGFDPDTGDPVYGVAGTDEAVVEVSTDGGASWSLLAGDLGGGAGNPATGASGGWRDASFDLTPYAGQTIVLRFLYAPEYISAVWPVNYIFGASGWAIDEIVIAGPSGTVFSDGAETLDPGWTSDWVRAGAVFDF